MNITETTIESIDFINNEATSINTLPVIEELTSAHKLLNAFEAGEKQLKTQVSLQSNTDNEIKAVKPNQSINALIDKFSKPKMKNEKTNKPVFNRTKLVSSAEPLKRPAHSYIQKAFKNSKVLQEVDGVDHINMSHHADTRLGRFLDINAYTPFYHRELLNFNSVGGLWYFVKCVEPIETFRYLHGADCRIEARKHIIREVEGFKTIIADATWIKINTNKDVIQDIVDSNLPFKNYFYSGEFNLKKSTPESIWYIEAMEIIRRTLKEIDQTGDESILPDFSYLETHTFSF